MDIRKLRWERNEDVIYARGPFGTFFSISVSQEEDTYLLAVAAMPKLTRHNSLGAAQDHANKVVEEEIKQWAMEEESA